MFILPGEVLEGDWRPARELLDVVIRPGTVAGDDGPRQPAEHHGLVGGYEAGCDRTADPSVRVDVVVGRRLAQRRPGRRSRSRCAEALAEMPTPQRMGTRRQTAAQDLEGLCALAVPVDLATGKADRRLRPVRGPLPVPAGGDPVVMSA